MWEMTSIWASVFSCLGFNVLSNCHVL
jgi:hypothetical protein